MPPIAGHSIAGAKVLKKYILKNIYLKKNILSQKNFFLNKISSFQKKYFVTKKKTFSENKINIFFHGKKYFPKITLVNILSRKKQETKAKTVIISGIAVTASQFLV